MNTDTKAIWAVASTMTRQFLTPYLIGGAVLLCTVWILITVLSINYSGWWLIVLLPLIPLSLLYILLTAFLWFLYKKLTPVMTKSQAKAVRQFTNRASKYSDNIGAPRYIIAFRVVRDVIRKRPRKYIGELVDASNELKHDFETVRLSFKQ